MTILQEKARVVVDALVAKGFLKQKDADAVCNLVFEQLRMGGSCQLLEDEKARRIYAKTIVRDDSAEIIGLQG